MTDTVVTGIGVVTALLMVGVGGFVFGFRAGAKYASRILAAQADDIAREAVEAELFRRGLVTRRPDGTR